MLKIIALIEKLKTLADPTRLKILKLLWHREHCVCELAAIMEISQPGVSQHLRRLKTAGFVGERRENQWIYYRAEKKAVIESIRELEGFFAADLSDLEVLRPELARMESLAGRPEFDRCRRSSRSLDPVNEDV